MKNGTNAPSDKSSIISCVPYRACVMVIIRATVAKVMQNNLERMLAACVMGGGRRSSYSVFQRSKTYSCYFTSAFAPFLTNALKIIKIETPF